MKPDTKKILSAASGGIAAAGVYGGANYMFRDFLVVDQRPTALALKQVGLGAIIGFAGWRLAKAGWVAPEFAYGAISFVSVMALIHVTVRTAIAVNGLPAGVRGIPLAR